MKTVNRWVLYLLGMLVLALGLTLNTKAGLGVSPIISIAFAVSEIWGWNFGDMTFLLYSLFVAGQFVLRGKNSRLTDLLQLPLSLAFSRVPSPMRRRNMGFWPTSACCWRPSSSPERERPSR